MKIQIDNVSQFCLILIIFDSEVKDDGGYFHLRNNILDGNEQIEEEIWFDFEILEQFSSI